VWVLSLPAADAGAALPGAADKLLEVLGRAQTAFGGLK
jgi:hypothetical protein